MIWIVTDEPSPQTELLHLIHGFGYATTTHPPGEVAARQARFVRPAIVILDCHADDAFAFVRAVRVDAFAGEVRLVVFADADVAAQSRLLAAGADAYVVKGGLDWADLLEHIRQTVGVPQRNGQARQS